MEWTIYSVGDAAFLESILNGIAMMQNDTSLQWLGAIGLLLGLFLVLWQSILGGVKEVNFQHSFVALILFYIMFGQVARVYIEDVKTGVVKQVDNVPWGIAAAGGLISEIGYKIAQDMEVAFGDARMTDEGFGTPLYLLLKVRNASFGKASTDTSGVGDLDRTLRNYIADCTLVAIDLGATTAQAISQSSGNLLNAIRFQSPVYSTLVQLPGQGVPVERSCADAWNDIDTLVTSGTWRGRFTEHMASILGTATPDADISNAFTAIGQSVSNGQTYMLNAVIKNVMYEAQSHDSAAQGAAIITTGAIEKLRVQGAAEGNLFLRMAKPLQTFIEGFVYALTPFMALLLAMGPLGMRLVGKYFLVLIWIQLWVPVMSVVNLYLHMSVQGELDALTLATGADLNLSSIAGMASTQAIAADYVSVAGVLTAATPMLTLMIVYGSSIAATSLAGRLAPKDTINEGIAAPDIAQNKALLTNESMMTQDGMSGMRAFGASSVGGKLSFGQESQDVVASSHQKMSTAQQGFMQTVGSTLGSNWSSAVSNGTTRNFTQGMSSELSHTHGMIQNLANSISNDYGLSSEQKQTLSAQAALGGGVGISGKVMDQFQGVDSNNVNKAFGNLRSQVENSQWQTKFAEAIKSDTTDSKADTVSSIDSEAEMNALQKSSSEAISASRSYNETSSWASKMGSTQEIDTFQAKNAIEQSEYGEHALHRIAAAGGVAAWARQAAPQAEAMGMYKGLGQRDIQNLLMVQALGGLGGPSNLSEAQQMTNMDNLKGLLMDTGVLTTNATTSGGAYANQAMTTPTSGVRETVEAGHSTSLLKGGVNERLSEGLSGNEAVKASHRDSLEGIQNHARSTQPSEQADRLWKDISDYAYSERAPVAEQLSNLVAGGAMTTLDTIQKGMMIGDAIDDSADTVGKKAAVIGASGIASALEMTDFTSGLANEINDWARGLDSNTQFKTPKEFFEAAIEEVYSTAKTYGMENYGLNESQADAYAHFAANPLERDLLNRVVDLPDFGKTISETEVNAIRQSMTNGNDHVLHQLGQYNELKRESGMTPLNEGPAHKRFSPQ